MMNIRSNIHSLLRPVYPIAAIICAALGVSGCAVWDFAEVRYQNGMGYFNTYYNARSLYNEAMEELDATSIPSVEASPSMKNPEQFGSSVRMAQAGMPFRGVAPSDDMDGATGDFDPAGDGTVGGASMGASMGGAPRISGRAAEMEMRRRMSKEMGMSSSVISKFDRVVEKCSRLLVHYPKSKWVDDALLMIGVSYYYKYDLIKSERKFNELLNNFPESDHRAEALMWMGRIYDRIDKTEDAEAYFRESIKQGIKDGNTDIIADAYYYMGEMYLTTNQEQKAVEAYSDGAQYTSSRNKRIRLELSIAREQESLGNLDKAQAAYRNIIKLDPELELLFKAELNYARISRLRGDIDEAINTLADMLDEPSYVQYDDELQLEIGHLYQAAQEYEAAVSQYQYCDTSFTKKPVSAKAAYALGKMYEERLGNYEKAYEYYVKAKLAYPGLAESKMASMRADAFEPYMLEHRKLNDLDTLLYYVLHPDSLDAKVARKAVQDSLDLQKRIAEGFDPNAKSQQDRMMERLARRRSHGRNTGRINPWRDEVELRKSAMPKTLSSAAPGALNPTAVPISPQPLYMTRPVRALSADSVFRELSIRRMYMGWIMFDNIGNLDSAAFYYEFALEGRLPDSLEAQAYYTLTQIYRQQNINDLVEHYEDMLLRKYSRSKYAVPILAARGMDIPKDSATVARDAYDRAAMLIERGDYRAGIRALRDMSESYSYSDQSVRAQLAMAMAYEQGLNDGPKAIEIYKSMVEKHPDSPYSKRAKEVLGAIEAAKNAPPPVDKTPPKDTVKPALENNQRPVVKQNDPRERFNAMRDSVLTGRKKLHDPTEDQDFPLGLPGEKKPANKVPPLPGQNGGQPPEGVNNKENTPENQPQ